MTRSAGRTSGGLGVMGVRGPIGAADLGWTSPHERLVCDLRGAGYETQARRSSELLVIRVSMAQVHDEPFAFPDNLVLDDIELMVAEIAPFVGGGGRTIVDATPMDLGRSPAGLAMLAERTGLQIVMGTGHYRAPRHPSWIASASMETVAAEMLHDVMVGRGGVRAGIIGEIGTQDPIHRDEELVLRAACSVQRATDRALFIHVDPWGRSAHALLDICERAGADVTRIVLCHQDATLPDVGYHRSLAARGAWVSYDMFGDDRDDYAGRRFPSDVLRVDAVLSAFDDGWADHLLLAHDICLKTRLQAYGGCGLDHLMRRVVPRLRDGGLSPPAIDSLFVGNPRRMLSHQLPV
jgi:phosphotriesterase-related protein